MGSERSRPCAKGLDVGVGGDEDLGSVSLGTTVKTEVTCRGWNLLI